MEELKGLFKSIDQSWRNDRYLIYKMLKKNVSFCDPVTGKYIEGLVDEVYRDVLNGTIRISICGRKHVFKEPTIISEEDGDIVFVYGEVNTCFSDDDLFDGIREGRYGESINSAVDRITPPDQKMVKIRIVL